MQNPEINGDVPTFKELSTRGEVAEKLGVTTRSVANYHALALDCVDDYFEDFPKVLNQRITNFRLSKYQSWVIWKLKQLVDTTRNSNLVKTALINDLESQKLLSKETFFQEQPAETNNEHKTIRYRK